MANSFNNTPVVLDTFSAAVNLRTSKGFPDGAQFYVKSIEWQTPTNVNHTATITRSAGGSDYVFKETCTVANQSVIKYFNDWIENLCIAISGVESGSIVIHLG